MKLVGVSVKRPVGVFMIFVGILALGFVALRGLAIDLYPKIDLPIAIVQTSYSGAAPQEVEKLISRPLESSLSSVEGINTVQSQSMPNASMIIMQFNTGTDLDQALMNVRERIDQVKGILPDAASDPSVMRFDPQQIPVMWIGLTGDEKDVLQNIAEDQIVPYFERTSGVASVTVEGGEVREILVEIDRAMLTQYQLTTGQVIQALSSENRSGSAGVITKGDKELQLRIDGEYTSLDDIRQVILRSPLGEEISLQEIAEVKDTFKDATTVTKVNGQESIVMSVMKKSDGNTVAVADGIYEAMDELKGQLPAGVELSLVFDTSTFIRESIDSVVQNMMLGALFSILVLFLFLKSFRSTLIIGVSIPIAVISTFALMYFTGETLNILTMGGLALGIGMMVDNSIVILENIFKYRAEGYSVKDAAVKGASELTGAVIAATSTSLVVFLPIIFVEGLAGEMFGPLAITVMFSLFASLVVAVTLIPMMSSVLLRKPLKEKKKNWFDRGYDVFTDRYKRLLAFALRRRKTTIVFVTLAFFGSLALAPFIGQEFVPASDQGQISINVETPSGSTLAETEAVANTVAAFFEPYTDIIETTYLSVGGGDYPGAPTNSNTASFTIQLIPSTERDIATSQVVRELNEEIEAIPGGEISVSEQSAGFGTGSPIQVSINGSDNAVLQELSEQVTWLLEDIDGIHNIESSASDGRPEIQIHVDREIAATYGLSYQEIMSEIQLGFNGTVATQFREDGDEIDVKVTLPEGERETISDLETLQIQTPSGTPIPISMVAEITQVEGPVMIQRENQQRQVNVTSDVLGRDLGSVSKDVEAVLATMNFPDGYSYSIGGQSSDMAESFIDLALALVFSVFLVYLVMAVQFESFLYPFVIMFAMPTTLIGILVGLFITGQSLSITSFIGVIILAGIVVNNAIVLVDYINILRERGIDRNEAILSAGPSRLRPILMTTLTTVLGMLPLAIGIGQGAEAQQPMAVVIIFGLTFSMLFTLVFVPVVYTYMDDFSKFIKRGFKRKKKVVAEDVTM